ncbi:MAG: pentapeptide repeat-containing protein [Spirirestis rafaelensis WJT71-NPBG6]|jgi:uncharacterized protein YjbI with pentapeptide repeats|nr:pentapeptide repeat-containing protein [Spirirestis rafaelensis WJT71-NPBG6]
MSKNTFKFLSRKLASRLLLLITILSITIVGIRILSQFNWSGFGEDSNKSISTEEIIKDGKFITTKRTTIVHEESAKSLWDWLELSSVLAIPIVLYLFQTNEERRSQKRVELQKKQADELAKTEVKIEKDKAEQLEKIEKDKAESNLREEAFQIYIDRMSEILTNKTNQSQLFSDEYKDNPVKDIVRIRTTTILRRLEKDKERQYRILHFLDDAELLGFLFRNANLGSINLSGLSLPNIDFTGANLSKANLSEANLSDLYLCSTNLSGANLSNTNFNGANLNYANLSNSNLSNANLSNTSLDNANFSDANLNGVNLRTYASVTI